MPISVQKISDDEYTLSGAGLTLKIDRDRFEDMFYAIPEQAGSYKNETEFFRQLTDNVAQDQAERDIVNQMLDAETDKSAAIRSIQDQVRALGV